MMAVGHGWKSQITHMGDTDMAKRKVKAIDVQESTPQRAVDLVPLQREVQRVFDAVRDVIDADLGTLKRPTGKIVVNVEAWNGNRQARSGVLGHFAPDRWKDGTDTLHQIAISPYFLGRPGFEQVGTFAHEYFHNVARTNGIQDTSRQGRFHNKAFASLVALTWLLEEGERSKQIGVTTKASERCKIWCAEELQPDFGSVSKLLEAKRKPKKATTVRLECPNCGFKATVSVKSWGDGFRPLCEGVDGSHDSESLVVVG
jgi:hypothetical protein